MKRITAMILAILMLTGLWTVSASALDVDTTEQAVEETAAEQPEETVEDATAPVVEEETQAATDTTVQPTEEPEDTGITITREKKTEIASVGAANTKLRIVEPLAKGNRIRWYAFAGAKKYRVFVKSGSTWKKLADTMAIYYDHTAAKLNTSYTYTVRAMNAAGKWVSGYDKTGLKFVRRTAPSFTSIENIAGGVKVKIKSAAGATQNCVFVKGGTFGTSWKKIKYGTTTVSVPITKGNGGKKLTFVLRSADAAGNYTSVVSATKTFTIYDAPTLKMTVIAGAQKLTVNKIAGAYNYRIFIKNGTSWKKLADTKADYTNYNVAFGKTYVYTVRAMDYYGKFISGYYTDGFSLQYLEQAKITMVENIAYGQRIYWNKLAGADHYRVFYYTNSNATWKFATDSNRNYADFDMSVSDEGVLFTYTVRAVDAYGNYISSYNVHGTSLRYSGTPEITCIENFGAVGLVLTVYLPGGVDRGQILLKNGSAWDVLGEVTGDEYVIPKPVTGMTYIFSVRGMDKNGNYITPYDTEGWKDVFNSKIPRSVSFNTIKLQLQWACSDAGMRYKDTLDDHADHVMIAYTGIYGKNTGDITDEIIKRGKIQINKYLDRIDSFGYKPSEYKFMINMIEVGNGEAFFVLLSEPV